MPGLSPLEIPAMGETFGEAGRCAVISPLPAEAAAALAAHPALHTVRAFGLFA